MIVKILVLLFTVFFTLMMYSCLVISKKTDERDNRKKEDEGNEH